MGDKFWIAADGVLGLEEENLEGCRKLQAPVTWAATDLADGVKDVLADSLAWDALYGHDWSAQLHFERLLYILDVDKEDL
jgi:hypothetical protein